MADVFLGTEIDARRRKSPSHWRRLFLIDEREASFTIRGFAPAPPAAQARLEAVGRAFIAGYRAALLSEPNGPSRGVLAAAPRDFQGFVAEGAAMGCAVAHTVSPGGRRLGHWINDVARDYSYLAHVGVGWALARLPFGHAALTRHLDPIHHWLAFDGMGFHDAYFRPARVLAGWRRVRGGYQCAAYDQGVGRALWFVTGADVVAAAAKIGGFPA